MVILTFFGGQKWDTWGSYMGHMGHTAFKLLTSKDPYIRRMAHNNLAQVTKRRATLAGDNPVTTENQVQFLNGEEGPPFSTVNVGGDLRSVWSEARNAKKRLKEIVTWEHDEDDGFSLKIEDSRIIASRRLKTVSVIKTKLRKKRDGRMHSLVHQGNSMKLVSKSRASSNFIRSGQYTRFADWRFIHRARLNLLPLKGNW